MKDLLSACWQFVCFVARWASLFIVLGALTAVVASGQTSTLFSPEYAPTLTGVDWHVQAPTDHPEALQLKDAPAGGPARALRAELQPGWNNPVGNTSRAEVYALHAVPGSTPASGWPLAPGKTVNFRLAYYFQAPWPTVDDTTWLTVTQWKGYKGGSPPIALEVKRSALRFRVPGHNYDIGGLPVGRWTNLDITIRFSTSADGSWTLTRDGVARVPLTYGRTMDTYTENGVVKPDPIYLKQGIYRSTHWNALGATHIAWFAAPVVTDVAAATTAHEYPLAR